mgnify:FL=1
MNILYVSSFVYRKNSSAAIRNNKLIEGLISAGHKVDVHTISHSAELTDAALLANHKALGVLIEFSEINSISNVASAGGKKKLKKYLPKTIYNFIRSMLAFPDADKRWLNKDLDLKDEYDIVISSSDTKTSHFVVEKILKNKRITAKWVQIWGDPWASDVNLDFFTKKIVSFYERNLLKQAFKIFYVSELTATEYKKKFPIFSHKIRCVGRSYYKRLLVDTSCKEKKEMTFFYPGSLNENRSIVKFCESIRLHNDNNIKQIKINVCGHQTDDILNRYKQYTFVQFMGAKGIDEVYSEFNFSDYLLLVDNGNDSPHIPGKLFDYYGTNLPIIALISRGNLKLKEYLSIDGRTLILDKDDLVNLNCIVDINALNEVDDYYSPESVARRLLNVL